MAPAAQPRRVWFKWRIQILKPSPSWPMSFSCGISKFSKVSSPVGEACAPILSRSRRLTPGCFKSTERRHAAVFLRAVGISKDDSRVCHCGVGNPDLRPVEQVTVAVALRGGSLHRGYVGP